MLDRLGSEFRQTMRTLCRRPGHSTASVATLALVMGANAALFATVDATFLRPLALESGNRAVRLFTLPPGSTDRNTSHHLHEAELLRFRKLSRTLERFASWTEVDRIHTTEASSVVRVSLASAELFDFATSPPVLGRGYTSEEDAVQAPVTVLSFDLWQTAFGGDPAILGRRILLDGTPYEVVGVMPQAFPPHFMAADLWTPLGLQPTLEGGGSGRSNLKTIACLKEGHSLQQANAEITSMMAGVVRERPAALDGWRAGAMSLRAWAFGDLRKPTLLLQGAMTLLLGLAALNVGVLAFANVTSRAREFGLRHALGARRTDVARLVFFEVTILNLVGTVGGLLLANPWLAGLLRIHPAATRELGPVAIDWRVALYAHLCAFGASVLASAIPVFLATAEIQRPGRGANQQTRGSRRESWRAVLLSIQTATAVALLVCGGLFVRALQRDTATDPGYRIDGVLTTQIRLPATRYPDRTSQVMVVEDLLSRLRALPGVVEASIGLNDFVPGNQWKTMVRIEGRPSLDGTPYPVQFRRVSPGYFETLEIPVLHGRDFDVRDREDSARSIIVSRRFAAQYLAAGEPLGMHIQRAGATWKVVGVVGDVADVDVLAPSEPTVYVSWAQASTNRSPLAVLIRTGVAPERLTATVRQEIARVDPNLIVDRILPGSDFLRDCLAPSRFRATLLAFLALVGLFLGALGIAGLTIQTLAARRLELGIRLALGAINSRLWTQTILRQIFHASWGTLVGLLAGLGLGRVAASILPGIEPFDPFVVITAALLLTVTGALSTAAASAWVLHLDPLRVLREIPG